MSVYLVQVWCILATHKHQIAVGHLSSPPLGGWITASTADYTQSGESLWLLLFTLSMTLLVAAGAFETLDMDVNVRSISKVVSCATFAPTIFLGKYSLAPRIPNFSFH